MSHFRTSTAVLAVALVAAGCSRSVPSFDPSPAPLTPAPAGRVSSNQLPPPPPPPAPSNDMQQNADAQTGSDGTQVAALGNNTSSGEPLSRNSVLGAYKVTTDGGNCQIILSLTKWTGGYRAASRGCPGRVADVSAWDVSGNQVVLKDSGGSNVASLNKSGGSRYEGTTNGGQSISLYR